MQHSAGVGHFGHRFLAFWLSHGVVTLWCYLLQVKMPSWETFPLSVYQKTGAAEMLPQLLNTLNPEDLRSVCARHLAHGLRLGDEDIPVTHHAEKLTLVYVRDLRYEVASYDVLHFFSTFGEVLTVERFSWLSFALYWESHCEDCSSRESAILHDHFWVWVSCLV